ncbi:MAG TPA: glycosyltransferase [Chloroflexota bacterium]|nr:glycosyltransferase [Chloroflexota bacterium]
MIKLDHLYRLTDNTGIYQHARWSRPNPEFGYCLDDNARALVVAIRAHALTGENGLLDYVRHYLAFVERCQRADGRFHNFMSADGKWLDEFGSEDSHGRALWALGYAARHSPQVEVRARALQCLDRTLPALNELRYLRAAAFTLLGLAYWREAEPADALDNLTQRLSALLQAGYKQHSGDEWHWFEDELTYCNARLPEALLATPGYETIGLESLTWLCEQLEVDGSISLIGSNGWYQRGGERAMYDQQAVDASGLVSACVAAYRHSGQERFRNWARLAYEWFHGRNPGRRPMIDPDTGGCFDGLQPAGVNQNQGAESLLAWLLAWEDMSEAGWL